MYLLIVLIPLLSLIFCTALNRKLGAQGLMLSICLMFTMVSLSYIAFIETSINNSPVFINICDWFSGAYITTSITFSFDSLTVSMLIPIITVSFLVQLYSYSYMHSDAHVSRFFSYLNLFSFSMLLLVTGENILVMFLGWEGVGVASYLLINFWFTRVYANLSALKAFLINRIGDCGLTLSILLALNFIGDIAMPTLFSLAPYLNDPLLFTLTLLFLIGAMAKSAQLGLHTWLASAMEGPTPVSALLHSATMVTAGVYLLIRFSPLFEYCSSVLLVISWLGGLSALLGAACGLLEPDLKKVIAFSTTSQLGYMITMSGLSQYSLSLFHLLNHAMFKALLFLSAGAVIHAMCDEQDIRKLGGLIIFLPSTYALILLGSLSLMAFPFLTGFYSKDFLLELALVPRNYTSSLVYVFTLLAALLTSLYSSRLLLMTFLSKAQFPKTILVSLLLSIQYPYSKAKAKAKANLNTMLLPLLILSLGSVYLGYLTHNLFVEKGSTLYFNSVFIHPQHVYMLDGTFEPMLLKSLPLLTLLVLIIILPIPLLPTLSFIHPNNNNIHQLSTKINLMGNININTHLYSNSLNHFNIYNHWLMVQLLTLAHLIYRYLDRGLIEYIGPTGLISLSNYLSLKWETFSTGFIPHYALILIIFTVLFTTYYNN